MFSIFKKTKTPPAPAKPRLRSKPVKTFKFRDNGKVHLDNTGEVIGHVKGNLFGDTDAVTISGKPEGLLNRGDIILVKDFDRNGSITEKDLHMSGKELNALLEKSDTIIKGAELASMGYMAMAVGRNGYYNLYPCNDYGKVAWKGHVSGSGLVIGHATVETLDHIVSSDTGIEAMIKVKHLRQGNGEQYLYSSREI